MDELSILYEDNHLLAALKPAGWPSTHFDGTKETFDRRLKEYLRVKYQKPGNVFLGVVHRLDQAVSGVMVFARTSKAAARLSEQFRLGTVEKSYSAVIPEIRRTPSSLSPWYEVPSGTMSDELYHDETLHKVEVVSTGTLGGKPAVLSYERLAMSRGMVWLRLRPRTGRKHQLRVQLASRGTPIIGDFKYGSEVAFPEGIALHAERLSFTHPTKDETVTLTADPPPIWRRRLRGTFPEMFDA